MTNGDGGSDATRRNDPGDDNFMVDLVYGKFGMRRYTQDSPVLLDVFTEYFRTAGERVDLLITPDWSKTPAQLAERLRTSLEFHAQTVNGDDLHALAANEALRQEHSIAYNQSVVAARLTFRELVLHVLPLSWWWRVRLIKRDGVRPRDVFFCCGEDDCTDYACNEMGRQATQQLREGLEFFLRSSLPGSIDGAMARRERGWIIRRDLIWASYLLFAVSHPNLARRFHQDLRRLLFSAGSHLLDDTGVNELIGEHVEAVCEVFKAMVPKIIEAQDFAESYQHMTPLTDQPETAALAESEHLDPRDPDWVFLVHRNRKIERTVHKSTRTTKADAADRAFDVRGEGLRWAVVDSGIDATHLGFRQKNGDGRFDQPFQDEENRTRVKATYDFTRIREHLSVDQRRTLVANGGRLIDWAAFAQRQEERYHRELAEPPAADAAEARRRGAALPPERPWRFHVPHNDRDYLVPNTSHGTHVAGILAADWDVEAARPDPLGPPLPAVGARSSRTGMCPEIEMYDLRVFNDGDGDEFSVISALQFVRSLNQQNDTIEIHGVNLSLAIAHDVNNYACGRSPVCEESTRLVGNGVVVVAAAGNDGRSVYTSAQGGMQEGYRTVSIADPGNAEAVITVGSTHRSDPHIYGVSYFSSRGPTGDGRMKPDLVAPGEKVYSTVPGNRFERQDGTSQAAPHVSGAAALLMCRHRELIGQPVRVKQVLMETATDLGREKHYQGAGLVDVMRAIQSV